MSIHIFSDKKRTDLLFVITDQVYSVLAVPLEILEKKTGVFIDEYGDTRLCHQHAMLLLQAIKNEIAKPGKPVMDFIDFLEKLVKDKTDVELIGD